jgi:hypothetical protein
VNGIIKADTFKICGHGIFESYYLKYTKKLNANTWTIVLEGTTLQRGTYIFQAFLHTAQA